MEPAYSYRATVRRIIDADTVVFDIDLGFRVTAAITGRIAGVNAPERYTAEGKAATAWVEAWLGPQQGTPARLIVESHNDARSFERWVLDAYRIVGDQAAESLADALIDAGHGEPA